MPLQNTVFYVLIVVLALVLIAVFRALKIVKTNERIAEQQARSIELQERSVRAMERVADALEARAKRD